MAVFWTQDLNCSVFSNSLQSSSDDFAVADQLSACSLNELRSTAYRMHRYFSDSTHVRSIPSCTIPRSALNDSSEDDILMVSTHRFLSVGNEQPDSWISDKSVIFNDSLEWDNYIPHFETFEEFDSADNLQELMEKLMRESEEKLDAVEDILRNTTPTGIDGHKPVYDYSYLLAASRSSIDVLRHLSKIFSHGSEAPNKVSEIHSKAEDVLSRWQALEEKFVAKENRAKSNLEQWRNFVKDLKAIEGWLFSISRIEFQWENASESILKLETLIEEYKELLLEVKNQKSIVESLNELMEKFTAVSQNQTNVSALQNRMKRMNQQWLGFCQTSESWQIELQKALLQSSEFHCAVNEILLWLKEMEDKVHAIVENETDNVNQMATHYNHLRELHQELEKIPTRVSHLQRMAEILIQSIVLSNSSYEVEENKILNSIQNQLLQVFERTDSLKTLCSSEITRLQTLLDIKNAEPCTLKPTASYETKERTLCNIKEEIGPSRMNRCCNYLMRVAKASFPVQALLFLLREAVAVFPISEEELKCHLSNNLARSFDPMSKYPNRLPPMCGNLSG